MPEEAVADYAIKEVFISDNNALVTAAGKTTHVESRLTLNDDDPRAISFGEFGVDVSSLRSDRSQRDRASRSHRLESAKFPPARFTVTVVENFPTDPQEGVPIRFQTVGDMTVKKNTYAEIWNVIATLEGGVSPAEQPSTPPSNRSISRTPTSSTSCVYRMGLR